MTTTPDQLPLLPIEDSLSAEVAPEALPHQPLGTGYQDDERRRREAIIETRGEDLAKEATGWSADTPRLGTSEPPKLAPLTKPRRIRTRPGPDYHDDPRLETEITAGDPTTVTVERTGSGQKAARVVLEIVAMNRRARRANELAGGNAKRKVSYDLALLMADRQRPKH